MADPTKEPRVTLIITQRERFAFTQQNLSDVYRHTELPFRLIYVDAGSPKPVRDYLTHQAVEKGFRLLRCRGNVSPNYARNLGIPEVDTDYALFLDNDIALEPLWLEKLLGCADTTGASIVGPLYLEGQSGSEIIHMAGGDFQITEKDGKHWFRDHHRYPHARVSEIKPQLKRQQVDFVEFHCMLVRMDLIREIGGMDESLLSLHEHVDFQLRARGVGATVFIEPAAHVTYTMPERVALREFRFWMQRWSEAWNEASLDHFYSKWGFEHDYAPILGFAREQRQLALVPGLRSATKMFSPRVSNKIVREVLRGEPRINRLFWRSTAT